MALFSSTQSSLRARILPKFPANVLAGSGMTITKSGLTYTFSVTFLSSSLVNAANDSAAAVAGVTVGQIYRNGSVLMIRVA